MAIGDTDLLLVSRGGTNYKVTGSEAKEYFGGGNISTPKIVSPANGATGQPETPYIVSSPFFSNDEVIQHTSTSWQVAQSSDPSFSAPVVQILNDTTNLTSLLIPRGELSTSTTYLVRCRYNGTGGFSSGYSPASTFTTTSNFSPPLTPANWVTVTTSAAAWNNWFPQLKKYAQWSSSGGLVLVDPSNLSQAEQVTDSVIYGAGGGEGTSYTPAGVSWWDNYRMDVGVFSTTYGNSRTQGMMSLINKSPEDIQFWKLNPQPRTTLPNPPGNGLMSSINGNQVLAYWGGLPEAAAVAIYDLAGLINYRNTSAYSIIPWPGAPTTAAPGYTCILNENTSIICRDASGSAPLLLRSTDGMVSYSEVTDGTARNASAGAYFLNDRLVNPLYGYSLDGLNWVPVQTPPPNLSLSSAWTFSGGRQPLVIAYGAGACVIAYPDNTSRTALPRLAWSYDMGINWTSAQFTDWGTYISQQGLTTSNYAVAITFNTDDNAFYLLRTTNTSSKICLKFTLP